LFGEEEGGVLVFSNFRFFKGMLDLSVTVSADMVAVLVVDEAEMVEAVVATISVEQWWTILGL